MWSAFTKTPAAKGGAPTHLSTNAVVFLYRYDIFPFTHKTESDIIKCTVGFYQLEAAARGIEMKQLEDTCKAELKAYGD